MKNPNTYLSINSDYGEVIVEGREFRGERKQHEGGEAFLYMTPKQARQLATRLLAAATSAEAGIDTRIP